MTDAGQVLAFPYKPLYMQVKESLVRRLIDGAWQPGQLIPSEMDLAREVGVSQGTLRKALDAMTADNLLVRRQGRGTFVAEPEANSLLFRFFRISLDNGDRAFPESTLLERSAGVADAAVAALLGLTQGAPVWTIERVRSAAGIPLIAETITVPADRFAGFDRIDDIPNNVYRLYSERWGITISRASERLKAVAATPSDARSLGCPEGTPLLEIARVAYDLEDRPVELRLSRCLTQNVHYSSELG